MDDKPNTSLWQTLKTKTPFAKQDDISQLIDNHVTDTKEENGFQILSFLASKEVKKGRRKSFWRGAILASVAITAIVMVSGSDNVTFPSDHPQIAHLSIYGGIGYDAARNEMLAEMKDRENIYAMIISVESPGGGVYESEYLYKELRAIGADIPVIVHQEAVAASGGYLISLAGDHILASDSTITGSIGVIASMVNIEEALAKLGIREEVFRTSEIKGGLSPLRTPSQEEIEAENKLLAAMQNVFKSYVSEERGLTGEGLEKVTNGSVFVGKEAVELGLVDGLGMYEDALNWLYEQNSGLETLPIEFWEPIYPEYDAGFLNYKLLLQKFGLFYDKNERQELPVKAEMGPLFR